MAGENEDVDTGTEGSEVTEGQETQTEQTTVEYTDVEKRAMEQGWVPESEYKGTKKWRSAEDFLDRGELFAKIDEMSRRLKGAEATLLESKKHTEMVRKNAFKQALAALKEEKKQALDEGDTARAVEIDEEILDKREEARQAEIQAAQIAQQPTVSPEFVEWTNRNRWYEKNELMRLRADEIGHKLAARGTSQAALLSLVEAQIKREFADEFTNPNRAKPGAVEGGGSRGTTSKDTFELTPDERRVMNKFVKAGLMTEKEYIADIKAERG